MAPLDAELGVGPGTKFTRRVVRAMVFTGAHVSFEQTSRAMKENFGLEIGHSQVAKICAREGERIARSMEERERQWRDGERPAEHRPETLVLMADATAVLTRAGEEHKMVNVVRAFDLSDRTTIVQTLDIEEDDDDDAPPPPQSKQAAKAQRAMLAKSRFAGTAKEEACAGKEFSHLAAVILALAASYGAVDASRVVCIADGCPVLWGIFCELFPDAIMVQDLWHANHYLFDAAKVLIAEEKEARKLGRKWGRWLRKSRIDDVIEELAAGRRKSRSDRKRKILAAAIQYLENGRDRMDYAAFEAAGLPISSGPIESACKGVVSVRYDLPGARWARATTGYMLALRLALANNEWDQYWQQTPAEQLLAA